MTQNDAIPPPPPSDSFGIPEALREARARAVTMPEPPSGWRLILGDLEVSVGPETRRRLLHVLREDGLGLQIAYYDAPAPLAPPADWGEVADFVQHRFANGTPIAEIAHAIRNRLREAPTNPTLPQSEEERQYDAAIDALAAKVPPSVQLHDVDKAPLTAAQEALRARLEAAVFSAILGVLRDEAQAAPAPADAPPIPPPVGFPSPAPNSKAERAAPLRDKILTVTSHAPRAWYTIFELMEMLQETDGDRAETYGRALRAMRAKGLAWSAETRPRGQSRVTVVWTFKRPGRRS